jgi:uncharacterized membrane protein YhhN
MDNILIIIGGSLLLAAHLYCEKKSNNGGALITKSFLSLLFVITALLQPHLVPAYFHYLIAGLILCLVGDVCLALPGERVFQAGLVAFLLGHVFYIFGFSFLTEPRQWFSPGAFFILGISGFIFFWLRPYLKRMLIPVLLYILVITGMVLGAWAVFWKTSLDPSGKAFILAGALCFYLSDIFVARDKFIKKEYRNRLIGLPLYYLGQFLLAFSVGLLR